MSNMTFDINIENITELFWRKGFNATSTEDLEQASTLNRASIYKKFGSKEKLFLVALRHYYQQVFEDGLSVPLRKHKGGVSAIIDFFQQLRNKYHENIINNGCLLVNTIAELGEGCNFAVEITNTFLEQLRFLMLSRLKESLNDSSKIGEAQLFADTLVGSTLGLLVMCRGRVMKMTIENIFEQIFIWLDRYQLSTHAGT